jgi:hypothetical protein
MTEMQHNDLETSAVNNTIHHEKLSSIVNSFYIVAHKKMKQNSKFSI